MHKLTVMVTRHHNMPEVLQHTKLLAHTARLLVHNLTQPHKALLPLATDLQLTELSSKLSVKQIPVMVVERRLLL